MKDDGDLELAREPIEQVPVQDVADPRRRAAARELRVERTHVESQDVEPAELGETMDQPVPHLAARARHQDRRSTRHRLLAAASHLGGCKRRAVRQAIAIRAKPARAPRPAGEPAPQMGLIRHTLSPPPRQPDLLSAAFFARVNRPWACVRRAEPRWQPCCSPTGAMSHCFCGHSEESHPVGGQCRAPGCPCDRFRPVPEVLDGDTEPARRTEPRGSARRAPA